MPREVIESVKVTIKTEEGIAMRYESKGNAPRGLIGAFTMLPAKRRAFVLKHLQAEDAKLREAEGPAEADAMATGVTA